MIGEADLRVMQEVGSTMPIGTVLNALYYGEAQI